MAQDIVGSLFGMQQEPNYFNQDYQTAVALANADSPKAMGRFLGGMIGSSIGRSLGQGAQGLLGIKNPQLEQASVIREAQQQGFDVTKPEGLQQLAQFFVQRGQPGLASQVAQQMQTMQKTNLETQVSQENLQRGQQYRAAIAELQKNPNATEQDYINLARQFATPEAGMTAAINAQSRADIAQQKQAIKDEQTQLKQQEASKLAFERASNIVDATSEAIQLVHGRSAGPLGQQLMAIGGTDAANLESKLKTVKSLLAVTELQKIREASKTGGALGNVSNKDIDLLESTVTNLNQKQSPDELRKGLEKVKQLYSKILEDAGIKAQQPAGQQSAQQPAVTNVRRWNPKTGEFE